MKNRYKAAITTLGCKVNLYEEQMLAEAFEREGFLIFDFNEVCDAYVINTCAVTTESERKSRNMIRRAKKRNPSALVIACGCMTQLSAQSALACGAVMAFGNTDKAAISVRALEALDSGARDAVFVRDISGVREYEDMAISSAGRARAFVKIQDGCSCKCSFCIVPTVRGPSRSRRYEDILSEIRRLADGGAREAVLTGIEISTYESGELREERGKSKGILALIENLERDFAGHGRIKTIRLGSVDPVLLDEKFALVYKDLTLFAPHLHLSLQSGSSAVLAAMKRRYNVDMVRSGVGRLREVMPALTLTADFIAGFPGESEDDFSETVRLAHETGLYHAHIFTYSPRPGTPAALLPGQVPEEVKKKRAGRLAEEVSAAGAKLLNERVGGEGYVIIEESSNGFTNAKSREYFDVRLKQSEGENLYGEYVKVKYEYTDGKYLYASLQ